MIIQVCWQQYEQNVVNVLKSVYLSLRKVKVRNVRIVEFRMYSRCGDGVGCFEVKL